jgi:hypothetical protein
MASSVLPDATMKPLFLVSLFAVLPLIAQSQFVSVGVKGGVPTRTPLGETGNQMPYIAGVTAEFRVLPNLSIETGLMFHRLGKRTDTGLFLYPENTTTILLTTGSGHAVEVPVLARLRFFGERHTWRPFLSVGPTFRRTSLNSSYLTGVLSGTAPTPSPVLNRKVKDWSVDPTVGAGVDFKAGRFHLEPEVRYSYWSAGKNSLVRKNQASFLLGFRF